MSRVKLLYYLFNNKKKPVYVDEITGHIMEGDAHFNRMNGQPANLLNDPVGWKDTLVKIARNIKYWGLFRDMTVPMQFFEDGAKIIKDRFVHQGIEALMYFGIAKFDPLNLPYRYDPWYLSELNFLKYKEDRNGCKIEALEGGVSKYLKAYENTVFEIPIASDPEHVSVVMDGMELENSATWFVSEDIDVNPGYNLGNHVVGLQLVQKEIEDIGGVFTCKRTKVNNNNTNIMNTGQWFFEATTDGALKIEYDFELDVSFTPPPAINPAAFWACIIRKIDKTGFGTNAHTLIQRSMAVNLIVTGHFHVVGTVTLPVAAGDKLFLYTAMNPEGATGDVQTRWVYGGDEPFFKAGYTFKYEKTIVKGLTPFRLGELLCRKMTDGNYGIKSSFLKSLDESIIVTSGNGLRGFQDATINISMSDFFKTFNRWMIGLGVEGEQLVIEKLEYFFDQNSVIYDAGEVKNPDYAPAEDLYFNTIYVGYKEQEYKDINGRLEFNQGQHWKTPVTRIQRELDLTSPSRADAFGIELLRINFGQKTTTDTKSDNETFLLNVKPQYGSFTANIEFTNFFNLMLIHNQYAQMGNFQAGVRFKITGTQFNNAIFTSAGVGSNNGVDLIVGAVAATVPGGINLVPENAPAANVQFLTYVLNRPAYSSVTGLLHPATAFNIELSPKRSLLANGAYIRSILDRMDGQKITLTSADRNTELVTTLNGVTISELTDEDIGTLAPQMFRPYYFTFTAEVPINWLEIMRTNPYGKIKFTVEGEPFYGFVVEGNIKPATNDAQSWKLLAAPETDLTKFYKR